MANTQPQSQMYMQGERIRVKEIKKITRKQGISAKRKATNEFLYLIMKMQSLNFGAVIIHLNLLLQNLRMHRENMQTVPLYPLSHHATYTVK